MKNEGQHEYTCMCKTFWLLDSTFMPNPHKRNYGCCYCGRPFDTKEGEAWKKQGGNKNV